MNFAIATAALFDGRLMRDRCWVEISAGRIAAIHDMAPRGMRVVELADDVILAPGFIDVQVNGGGGVLLNDAPTLEGIAQIATAHRRSGTTSLLPTLITDDPARMEALLAVADAAMMLPEVAGFHLEGPHLDPGRHGIHPLAWIRPPSARDVAMLRGFAAIGRSMVTLAPNCVDPALIEALVGAGLRVSLGHSDASAAVVGEAVRRGASGVTHLFNAMSQLGSRAPGMVGAALVDRRLFAGVIADGLHVDPLGLRLAFLAKGRDRLMLVTDAMPSVGSAADHFMLQGQQIRLECGRLTDAGGTLAGAHLSMIEAVGNAVTMMGAKLEDALAMASSTPARFLGFHDRGTINIGARADLVAFTKSFRVVDTWIKGR